MNRSLADVRLAALMLDGIELKGRCCVVCLGVTTDGVKVPLGLWDGSTENATVARHLLADLVDRGLDCEQGVLVVLDGGRRSGPPSIRCSARSPSSAASATRNATSSITSLIAAALRSSGVCGRPGSSPITPPPWTASKGSPASWPGRTRAPPRRSERASPRPSRLQRLCVHEQLRRTLSSTNPIESMIGICRVAECPNTPRTWRVIAPEDG